MAGKVTRSADELAEHFEEQIRFLERSACSFDKGFNDEAKRISTVLRILLHDTKSSHSLLGLLARKTEYFIDTATDQDKLNPLSHSGLIGVSTGQFGGQFYAPLDESPSTKKAFDDWWNEVVFAAPNGNALTRRQLVLIVANQDGGTHVDPTLNAAYAQLAKHNALGWFTASGDSSQFVPIQSPHLVALRQIAHEVLKTFRPGYSKRPDHRGVAFAIRDAKLEFLPNTDGTPYSGPPLGRNSICTCGSGRKFKRCHGKTR